MDAADPDLPDAAVEHISQMLTLAKSKHQEAMALLSTPDPNALQPGLQSNREGVLTPQGDAPQDRRANRQRLVGPDRQARRHLPAQRMRQLLQLVRI